MCVVDKKLINYLSVVTVFSLFLVEEFVIVVKYYSTTKTTFLHHIIMLVLFRVLQTILNVLNQFCNFFYLYYNLRSKCNFKKSK